MGLKRKTVYAALMSLVMAVVTTAGTRHVVIDPGLEKNDYRSVEKGKSVSSVGYLVEQRKSVGRANGF